jgi:tellurite resistance protein TehA-like permease
MALGILSLDAAGAGRRLLSSVLLGLALVAFVGVAAWNVASSFRPSPVLVLFTLTAACGVLAERLATVPFARSALVLSSVIGLASSVIVLAVVARPGRWPVDGSWFLAVVACQSVAIVTEPAAVAWALWIAGVALYCVLAGLFLRRLVTGAVAIAELKPDTWITMGALAISTVAADDLKDPAMVFVWIFAALWIPFLVVVEVAGLKRLRPAIRYDPLRWATVFPLGMFALATRDVATRLAIPALGTAAAVFFGAALITAVITAAPLPAVFRRRLRGEAGPTRFVSAPPGRG